MIAGYQLLTAFISKKNTSEELKVSMIELAQVYHGANHHHSYLSINCGIKINSKLYLDSIIGKKVHCGRTKVESIAENILAPKSIELRLEAMKAGTMNPVPFSLASDASNKEYYKLFPTAVKYFDIHKGVQNKIIDFYENSDESSTAVVNQFTSCLNECRLNIANVNAYIADNALVNYGKHNSVFQKLTAMNLSILKSNCNCHVIHNAVRNACKELTSDVENLILKVFSEFSNSAKKSQDLKEHSEFIEMEYEDVLWHVVTRWLSLFRALERVLSSWPAIKLYFIQQGEEETNKVIWSFVQDQEGELQDDTKAPLILTQMLFIFCISVHEYYDTECTDIRM
jgi:hypothetical protein